MRKGLMLPVFLVAVFFAAAVFAQSLKISEGNSFEIKKFTPNDYMTFVKVFGEMRGPIRSEIMKDKSADFENADPVKYLMKAKDGRDVTAALKKIGMTWDTFQGLLGNVLLAYYSIQPQATKAGLIKKLADEGLILSMEQIPEEYRPMVSDVLKSEQGSMLASAALEMVIKIPPENIAIAREHEKDLDRTFYTKYWRDNLK